MIDREEIYSALFALLQKINGVRTISRKLKHWNDVEEFPAVFQTQRNETAVKDGRGIPIKWTLAVQIYVYVRSEPDKLSSPLLNEMLDAVELALEPPEPIDNKQTLGGLVHDCWIDGQVETDEGVLGELAVAIIPIKIIVTA